MDLAINALTAEQQAAAAEKASYKLE